jgi:hypothetical protein
MCVFACNIGELMGVLERINQDNLYLFFFIWEPVGASVRLVQPAAKLFCHWPFQGRNCSSSPYYVCGVTFEIDCLINSSAFFLFTFWLRGNSWYAYFTFFETCLFFHPVDNTVMQRQKFKPTQVELYQFTLCRITHVITPSSLSEIVGWFQKTDAEVLPS